MDMDELIKAEKKLNHDMLMSAMTSLIEAEVLGMIARETRIEGKNVLGVFKDKETISDRVLDAMTSMFPTGHKYESMRADAAIVATKQLDTKFEVFGKVLSAFDK